MITNEIITVVNEYGKKVDLELIDAIKMDGNEYVIVGPKDSDEAYAYRSVVKNGETEYSSIGVGAEFKKVLDKYNEHQAQ
ncbi:DUF1292 domain-containing protein [Clostridium bowmanii]|uniref:DUF1292 domain-containing protein n=1 Tax=Clostridium bowmanii TaxID=132925 RepID=UPI001C0DFABE|nr:DUF1292 domain-containing protein [Clostridium bowmanii]MBU3189845.1 DUF1292 domain-containing protein [Clostridium bowmanii]MCA1074329.1 DUF1292 domain-containing protein [Clostridium bowmanii]